MNAPEVASALTRSGDFRGLDVFRLAHENYPVVVFDRHTESERNHADFNPEREILEDSGISSRILNNGAPVPSVHWDTERKNNIEFWYREEDEEVANSRIDHVESKAHDVGTVDGTADFHRALGQTLGYDDETIDFFVEGKLRRAEASPTDLLSMGPSPEAEASVKQFENYAWSAIEASLAEDELTELVDEPPAPLYARFANDLYPVTENGLSQESVDQGKEIEQRLGEEHQELYRLQLVRNELRHMLADISQRMTVTRGEYEFPQQDPQDYEDFTEAFRDNRLTSKILEEYGAGR